MLSTKNSAGYQFVWPDGSSIVEVFHPAASFPDCPLEVVDMSGERRDSAVLRQLAYSTSAYARF